MNRKIIKNGFWNTLKTLFSILFPLITIPYISRVLGVENVGKISFSSSIVSYYSLLSSLGIYTYGVRECAKVNEDKKKVEQLASQIFTINMILYLLATILLVLILLFVPRIREYRIIIGILSIGVFLSTVGIEWLNVALEDFSYIAVRCIIFQALSIVLLFLFIKNQNDYIIYALISVFSSGAMYVVNIFHIRKTYNIKFVKNIDLKKHLGPVFSLFFLLVAQSILSNLDITMIGLYINDKAVGLYSSAVKIQVNIAMVLASIVYVLLPRLSFLFSQDDDNLLNAKLKDLFLFLYTLSVPISLGLLLLSKEILLIICGAEFENAAVSLSVLSISMFINLVGGSFWGNMVLLPSSRDVYFMVACIVSAVINMVLNRFVIPVWGIDGAAITTLISTVVIMFLCYCFRGDRVHFKMSFGDMIGPIIAGTGVGIVCLITKANVLNIYCRVVITVFVSCIVYYIVLRLFKNKFVLLIDAKFREYMVGKFK